MFLEIAPDDHAAEPSSSRKRSHSSSANNGHHAPAPLPAGTTGDEDDDVLQDDETTGDDDENSVISAESDTAGSGGPSPAKKRRKQFLNLNATFMAGIQGVSLVTDTKQVTALQETMLRLCNFGKDKDGFPGCQPVSMDLNNLNLLHTMAYRVSWKADGTRYMMLIVGERQVYFFDRDNSCFQVEGLRFLQHDNINMHLTNTVLDGEMVIDKVNELSIPRFLVYDVVRFNNHNLAKCPFYPTRLECIRKEIIGEWALI